MSRTTVIAMRYLSLAAALCLNGIYLKFLLPADQNVMNLKACIVFFLATYLLMTTGLLAFNRLRKFDIALICWAALAVAVFCQLGLSKIGLVPLPHISELVSGTMGILASLLPMCVANIRGESRQDRHNVKEMATRRMMTGTTQLIGH